MIAIIAAIIVSSMVIIPASLISWTFSKVGDNILIELLLINANALLLAITMILVILL